MLYYYNNIFTDTIYNNFTEADAYSFDACFSLEAFIETEDSGFINEIHNTFRKDARIFSERKSDYNIEEVKHIIFNSFFSQEKPP